jgi:hypothetical protein
MRSEFLRTCLAYHNERVAGAVVFLVHRDSDRFRTANAFETDLVELLNDERETLEAQLNDVGEPRVFVVISRDRLRLEVMSSPVRFPQWFPGIGGRELPVAIQDAASSFTVTITLGRVEPLARTLFSVDSALLLRVLAWGGEREDRRARNILLDLSRAAGKPRGNGEKEFDFFITAWNERVRSVTDKGQYRVERRGGLPSILSVLVESYQQTPPDSLSRLAKQLNEVFPVPNASSIPVGLSYVQRRVPHTGGTEDQGVIFWLNTLTAIACSANLVTAAHHANEFGGHFPAQELEAITTSLSKTLFDASELLR